MIKHKYIPKYALNALFEAFNELKDYKIIFTFKENKPLINVSSHILLNKWSPQFEILSHSKTKLFISHGGLKRYNLL